MTGLFVRTARSLLRPVMPMLKQRTLRIRSTPARGYYGYAGQWSLPAPPDDEELFLRRLDYVGKTIYDIGANVGATSLFFSGQVQDKGMVIGFEPNPDVFAVLKHHIELNKCQNVKIIGYAIGNETETSTLNVPHGGRGAGTLKSTVHEASKDYSPNADLFGGADSIEDALDAYEIQQITLDQFLDENDVPPPEIIKIDTEGFETECLYGMPRTLAEHHPSLFLEMHGYSDDEKRTNVRDIVDILKEHDYDLLHAETNTLVNRNNSDVAMQGHIFAAIDSAEMRSVTN